MSRLDKPRTSEATPCERPAFEHSVGCLTPSDNCKKDGCLRRATGEGPPWHDRVHKEGKLIAAFPVRATGEVRQTPQQSQKVVSEVKPDGRHATEEEWRELAYFRARRSSDGPWRTGQKVGNTIYIGETFAGSCVDPKMATMLVTAANIGTITDWDERRDSEAARQTGVEYYGAPVIPVNDGDQRVVDSLMAKATAGMKTRKLDSAEAPSFNLSDVKHGTCPSEYLAEVGERQERRAKTVAFQRERQRRESAPTKLQKMAADIDAAYAADGTEMPSVLASAVSPNASVTSAEAGVYIEDGDLGPEAAPEEMARRQADARRLLAKVESPEGLGVTLPRAFWATPPPGGLERAQATLDAQRATLSSGLADAARAVVEAWAKEPDWPGSDGILERRICDLEEALAETPFTRPTPGDASKVEP